MDGLCSWKAENWGHAAAGPKPRSYSYEWPTDRELAGISASVICFSAPKLIYINVCTFHIHKLMLCSW